MSPKKAGKKAQKPPSQKTQAEKISSSSRLEDLLSETEAELAQLEPQIEKIEKQIEKLRELKLAKQKLITFKLSIKSILSNYSEANVALETEDLLQSTFSTRLAPLVSEPVPALAGDFKSTASLYHAPQPVRLPGTFLPDRAFAQVNNVLRRKDSLNYEMFRAIVFNGGQANTEQIRQYLIEHDIRQPASGVGFEDVELTDISSRINYLVRKGLVNPDGRGNFISCLGWIIQDEA